MSSFKNYFNSFNLKDIEEKKKKTIPSQNKKQKSVGKQKQKPKGQPYITHKNIRNINIDSNVQIHKLSKTIPQSINDISNSSNSINLAKNLMQEEISNQSFGIKVKKNKSAVKELNVEPKEPLTIEPYTPDVKSNVDVKEEVTLNENGVKEEEEKKLPTDEKEEVKEEVNEEKHEKEDVKEEKDVKDIKDVKKDVKHVKSENLQHLQKKAITSNKKKTGSNRPISAPPKKKAKTPNKLNPNAKANIISKINTNLKTKVNTNLNLKINTITNPNESGNNKVNTNANVNSNIRMNTNPNENPKPNFSKKIVKPTEVVKSLNSLKTKIKPKSAKNIFANKNKSTEVGKNLTTSKKEIKQNSENLIITNQNPTSEVEKKTSSSETEIKQNSEQNVSTNTNNPQKPPVINSSTSENKQNSEQNITITTENKPNSDQNISTTTENKPNSDQNISTNTNNTQTTKLSVTKVKRATKVPEKEKEKKTPPPIESNSINKKVSSNIQPTQSKSSVPQNLQKPYKPEKQPKKIKSIFELSHVGFDGTKDKPHNQDISFIQPNFTNNKNYTFMSVCDGHGSFGHIVSAYIKKILPETLSRNLKHKNIFSNIDKAHKIIKDTYIKINDKLLSTQSLDLSFSGTTCVSLIFTPDKAVVPNIGDSRAVIAKFIDGEWSSFDLSRDHTVKEKDECERILKNNGRIKALGQGGPKRIWVKDEDVPGLAMTRSFGDCIGAKIGVIAEPEIREYEFLKEDKFIILATDGVWEFISSKEAVELVKEYYEKNDAKGGCEFLYNESRKRWMKEEGTVDDITVILAFLGEMD